MTFVGGMIVALAVEKSGLHRRLALKVLNAVGAKPSRFGKTPNGVNPFLAVGRIYSYLSKI